MRSVFVVFVFVFIASVCSQGSYVNDPGYLAYNKIENALKNIEKSLEYSRKGFQHVKGGRNMVWAEGSRVGRLRGQLSNGKMNRVLTMKRDMLRGSLAEASAIWKSGSPKNRIHST